LDAQKRIFLNYWKTWTSLLSRFFVRVELGVLGVSSERTNKRTNEQRGRMLTPNLMW
jgi:hypothetical protein